MIKQGHMRVPLSRIGLDDREFLFREGIYELDRSIFRFPYQVPTDKRFHWPSNYSGESSTSDKPLIADALTILKKSKLELTQLIVMPGGVPQNILCGSAQTASQHGTFPAPKTAKPLQIDSASSAVQEPAQRLNVLS